MTELKSKVSLLNFGPGLPAVRIGERINPTGKPKMQESIMNGDLSFLGKLAQEQEAAGANALGVNIGMHGIDEKSLLVRAVQELEEITSLPLYIDSSQPEALIAARGAYPHKPLVGSCTGEDRSYKPLMEAFLDQPAVLVVMLNDERGVSTKAEERLEVAEKILAYADATGFHKEDLVLDCMGMAVGAEPTAALECLKCIKELSNQGLSTIIGLSNVSFGMPMRNAFNRAFVAMAISAGLSAAILNPNSTEMVETVMAADVLANRDPYAMNFLEFFRSIFKP
ncbi:MAG: dihydropteroate synthase [Desulfobacteraceae bacterium]|nr:dihydropteroate synthase [Desulfobacteraceae bacterium]